MASQTSQDSKAGWHAGLSSVDITPEEPIWLAGWARRTEPSAGVSHRIYSKALAIRQPDGEISILVGSDLVAYSAELVDEIAREVRARFGIERSRLVLCASHNHSGPVIDNVLPLYYELDAQQQRVISRYTRTLRDHLLQAIELAIADLAPAEIEFGQNIAGFAINRRRFRFGGRSRPGPVDHDVPVLTIRRPDGKVRGILFGYACHTTSIDDGKVNADYAGYAQSELESLHPGAIAIFVAGCGGDAGTQPRYHEGLGQLYGHVLALAVDEVVRRTIAFPAEPVYGPLATAGGIVNLPLEPGPSRKEFESMLPGREGIRRREIELQLARLESGKSLQSEIPYPVQVWRFGSGHTFVIMSSEVVVDYSLKFKQMYGFDKTWVMAYANEHIAYIPSQRVLEEGDYEGTLGMLECGFPAPFTPDVERTIISKIDALWNEARPFGHDDLI